jgi:NAD(P)H-hydrate epimerase
MIVGGSAAMAGAAFLAARATLRSGAGLCMIALPKSVNLAAKKAVLEATTLPLAETNEHTIAEDAVAMCLEHAKPMSVVAIGPGLSRNLSTARFTRRMLAESGVPAVIDADAIVAWRGRRDELNRVSSIKVLTPHSGEMAMLMGMSVAEVERDRVEAALKCARESDAIVLLKGARSVIANAAGEVWVNVTGNPGMATGGSGDVLTGLIAALIAQGMPSIQAAVAGAYLHGRAGDAAAVQRGKRSVVAGDLVEHLSSAFGGLEPLHATNQFSARLYRLL